jgi:Protein of unknown function (DUF429)
MLTTPPVPPQLLGVDFTCAPGPRKPITVARGRLAGDVLTLESVEALRDFAAFELLLRLPGPWLGAFDFPFGLSRGFVDALALGEDIDAVITELHRRCAGRMAFRALVDTWGNGRPAGQRLLHRRCDAAQAGVSSTSPLQTRYVPVGFMFFEGLSRLVHADVTLPQMRAGDPSRVALEGYPGLLAHELIGRLSYKNSAAPERHDARVDMLRRLEAGQTRLALRLRLSAAQRKALHDDAAGDWLDAVLCLLQAAWASRQPRYGLPAEVDPVEGWIVSAGV